MGNQRILILLVLLVMMSAQAVQGASDHFMMMGIAEISVGYPSSSKLVEPVDGTEGFADKLYYEGRIAFLLRGKVKGKYLMTAWMDTENQPLDQLFQEMVQPSNPTLQEQFQPERYYPVYIDASQSVDYVDSKGKFFVKIESDTAQALWGNYATDLTQTELVPFQRNLYGLLIEKDGKEEEVIKAFWSPQPGTFHSQDLLKATGGSLYYLHNENLLAGTEQLRVEHRDSFSHRVLDTVQLTRGVDYEIDWVQGRVILQNQLTHLTPGQSLIQDEVDPGQELYLVADYEYIPETTFTEKANYGLRLTEFEANPYGQLGQTIIQQTNEDGESALIYGVDGQLGYRGTRLEVEWANSRAILPGVFYSEDGGLSYLQQPTVEENPGSNGYRVSLVSNLQELNPSFPAIRLENHLYHWDKGFSNQRKNILNPTTQREVAISGTLPAEIAYLFKYNQQEEEGVGADTILSLQGEKGFADQWNTTSELKYEQSQPAQEATNSKLLGALGLEYHFTEKNKIYALQQLTLHRENAPVSNRTVLGTQLRVSDRMDLNLEASGAASGVSVQSGASYSFGESQIYTDLNLGAEGNSLVIGNRSQLNDQLKIYNEHQFGQEVAQGRSDVIGLEYAVSPNFWASLDYTRTSQEGTLTRQIVTPAVRYRKGLLQSTAKFQYRTDVGQNSLQQYILNSDIIWVFDHELSMIGKLNGSVTREEDLQAEKHIEATYGLAYQPIYDDRLNIFTLYTYLEEMNPQKAEEGTWNESAHIISLEGIYDLTGKWQVAGKLAAKKGLLYMDAQVPTASITKLVATRANYLLRADWRLYGEYRLLQNDQAEEQKHGVVLGVTKDLPHNLVLNVGYNFAGFSDDLTDSGDQTGGFLLNLVKKW